MNRVVITGIAANSPIGCSVDEIFSNINKGTYGLSEIKNHDTSYFPTTFAGEVKSSGKALITDSAIDRKSVFIENAVNELLSKNELYNYKPEDIEINIGSGIDYFDVVGYINSGDYKSNNWQNHCVRSIDVINRLSEKYNIKGPASICVSACVASSQAIGLSFRRIRDYGNKAIISGGFDSMLSHLHYMGFYKLGALSNFAGDAEKACKPFDKNRSGLVIGEGGIAVLLESDALADKSKILAEIVGYSSTLDAFQVTDPEPEGKSLAMAAQNAINEAGITPNEIDCVHMHETGTIKNALAESNALKLVFKQRYKEIPVYSMKGQVGHLIGACGAMEMLGVIYSLKNQVVPVTVNFEIPDPDVPLNVIKNDELHIPIKYILKLNAAFGGQNTALVIKKYE